ncbi:MAG: Sodium/proton antiporter [Parcubacteria group bacterium GW2011_GWA2_46_10]|nr:MAG: Sodium/proton antiporter [Microgenomates group bacterium GW2011_GWA1_Microgenomates_45_10]KKU19050.1 MAG: Sodium/proton antiporter [Parcubacteria group bacterium GW2011_GWA2_46_10]
MDFMENQTQNPYVVPVAIVVAGLLIAGAVVYNGGSFGNDGLGNTAPTQSEVVTPAEVAKAVGLKKVEFEKCVAEKRGTERVDTNLQEATSVGIGGTPTSIIVTPSGEQYFMVGALPADMLDAYVAAAIEDDAAKLTELEGQFGLPDAPDVPVLEEGDHLRGSIDAPVVLIEYSDLECPYCKRFHPEVKQMIEKYGDKIVWAYRHFPLEAIHSSARPLAEGSECAAQLGGNDKFWEYVDYVFEN